MASKTRLASTSDKEMDALAQRIAEKLIESPAFLDKLKSMVQKVLSLQFQEMMLPYVKQIANLEKELRDEVNKNGNFREMQ